MKIPALLLPPLLFLLTACSGYQLGGNQPAHLRHLQTIAVPLAKNHTVFPRAEAHLTNAVVSAITRDGTYRVGRIDSSGAELRLDLQKMNYLEIRANPQDTLRSEELELIVHVKWALIDSRKPTQPLEKGEATGRTRFFVDANLQTARRNALPDAMQDAARDIVSRLADGF